MGCVQFDRQTAAQSAANRFRGRCRAALDAFVRNGCGRIPQGHACPVAHESGHERLRWFDDPGALIQRHEGGRTVAGIRCLQAIHQRAEHGWRGAGVLVDSLRFGTALPCGQKPLG